MNKKNLILAGTIFIGSSIYLKTKIDREITGKISLREKIKKHIPTIIAGTSGVLIFGYLHYLNRLEKNNISEISENISKYSNIINKLVLNNRYNGYFNILKSIASNKEIKMPKNKPENLDLFFECFTNTWLQTKKELVFDAVKTLNSDLDKNGKVNLDKFFNELGIKEKPGFNKVIWDKVSCENIGIFGSKQDGKDYTILMFDEIPKIKL